MPDNPMPTPDVPLTPEAAEEGQDPTKASDPSFEKVKEGQVDADSD